MTVNYTCPECFEIVYDVGAEPEDVIGMHEFNCDCGCVFTVEKVPDIVKVTSHGEYDSDEVEISQ